MTPDDLRALLAEVTPRPWRLDNLDASIGSTFLAYNDADARAIVEVMNRAELLVELWAAMLEDDMPPTPKQRAALDRLEES